MPPRLALVARGDPLTPHLHAALAQRYEIAGEIDVELGGLRRAAVAALTVRPSWSRWANSYMKSNTGFRVRSRLARRGLVELDYDVAVQTHALFRTHAERTVVYVDCTYREAMAGWPGWARHGRLTRRWWLRSETDVYRRALHLFVFTAEVARSLVDDYGIDAASVTVVGAGVNFDQVTPRLPGPRRPVVLFVGKDFARKGGQVLLDAFAQVRRAVPDARLKIVGTELPGDAPAGVEVLGMIDDRAEMARLYAEAAVFCLPSLFDPAPLVVLEAMGCGLPCVLSRGASRHVRELVDNGTAGLSAETGDADSLAAGLVTLLQDPERAERMGAAGYRAVTEGYLWSDVVERMSAVLDGLAPSSDNRS